MDQILKPIVIVALTAIVGLEAAAYYEAVSPSGNPSIHAFDTQELSSHPSYGNMDYPSYHPDRPRDDYYIGFLNTVVDANMVLGWSAFFLTLLFLIINVYYPLGQIHFPVLDSFKRDGRFLDIPDTLDELSSRISESSRAGLKPYEGQKP